MSSSEPNGRELGARRETSANWNTMTGSASRPNAPLPSTRTGRGACHGRSQYATASGSSVSTTYRPNQKTPRWMRLTRPIYQLHAPAAGDSSQLHASTAAVLLRDPASRAAEPLVDLDGEENRRRHAGHLEPRPEIGLVRQHARERQGAQRLGEGGPLDPV